MNLLKYAMNRSAIILVLILIFCTEIFASKMWKISTIDGANLSCTKLIEIKNDSLHTQMLGAKKAFAIQEITRITRYNRNVNKVMVISAIIGGVSGLMVDTYIKGNDKIDFKNNGATFTLMGLMGGTLSGHLFSVNESFDLSQMSFTNKKDLIGSLILSESP